MKDLRIIRRALADSLIYALAAIISRILLIIQVPLFSRIFGPQEFGILDLISISVVIINLVIGFEISQAVAIFFAEAKTAEDKIYTASSALWFVLVSYVIFTAAVWPYSESAFAYLIGDAGSSFLAKPFLISAFASGMFLITQNQLRWMLMPREFFLANIAFGATNILLSVFFVYQAYLGMLGIIYALSLSSVFGTTLCVYYARNVFKLRISLAHLKRMLYFSLPLVPSSILVFICLYVDRICINQLLGLKEVGLYAVASRFASVVGVLIIAFSRAFTPLIYNYYQEASTPAGIATLLRIYLLIGCTMILGLGLFSAEIITLLSGQEYYSAHQLLPLISASLIISNIYVFTPGLAIGKRTYAIAIISLAGAVVNLAMNVILIPAMGIAGAAWATVLSSAVTSYMWYILGHARYPIEFPWRRAGYASFFIMVLLASNYTLLSSDQTWILPVKSIVFLVSVYLLAGILSDIGELKSFMRLSKTSGKCI